MGVLDDMGGLDSYDSTSGLTQHWPGVGAGAFAFAPHAEALQGEWNEEEKEKEEDDEDIIVHQEPLAVNWDGKYACEDTVVILLTGIVIIQSPHSLKCRQTPKGASCLSYGGSPYFSCAYPLSTKIAR